MSKLNQLLALILIVAITITNIPAHGLSNDYVEDVMEQKSQEYLTDPQVRQSDDYPKILEEVKEKRDQNTKHFIREDKSYVAAVYPVPVHYLEDGEWVQIDNSFKEATDGSEKVFENKKNSYKVKFSQNTNSAYLGKLQQGKYNLAWSLEGIAKTRALLVDDNTEDQDNQGKNNPTHLKNIKSSIIYKDVFQHVDLQYDITSNLIKENIILREKVENPEYTFIYKTNNLKGQLKEDKTIIFYDEKTGETIFTIKKPFMFDSDGAYSEDIEIEFIENKNTYTLIIRPSEEWLNSSERVYPVIIDPPIETEVNRNLIDDVHVSSNYPTTYYWNSHLLRIGWGSASGSNRAYIKFTLPELTSADTIIQAYLTLYSTKSIPYNTQIDVHKVTQSWVPESVNWNTRPSYNSKIEDYSFVNSAGYHSWDITSIAKEWYTSGVNNGLMLKGNKESSQGHGYVNEFYSSDTSSAYEAQRPVAMLYYINNSGLESYWTYHSQSVGRAGTGYVNDYNGNLIFIHEDLGTTGNRMPISISHIFNSNERNDPDIGYGLGWRLNLSQRITTEKIGTRNYHVYTDGDGTKHYFHITGSQPYKDESGLNLELRKLADSTYTLVDKSGTTLTFTSSGLLRTIRDTNNNTATLNYSGDRLINVKDGVNRTITLTYANNKLSKITDPAGREITYTYDSGGRLTRITYNDGKTSNYTYNTRNQLATATNIDGYKITYTYYSISPYRVRKVAESNGTQKGQEITISYGNNITTFIDINGRKEVYQFNNSGNTVNIQDNEGYAQYYKFFKPSEGPNKIQLASKLQKTITNYLLNHNAELSGNWTIGSSTGSTGNGTIATEQKHLGSKSFKIVKTDAVARHYYSQTVTLEKGKTYTLSGYIRTSSVSSANNKGATLNVRYQNSSGNWVNVYSPYVQGSKGWERYEVTFTIPQNGASESVQIRLSLIEETGTAYFDSIQLEDGPIANRYNLLENGDFQYGTGTPTSWIRSANSISSDTIITDTNNPEGLDSRVFRITGESEKRKWLYQKLEIPGKKDEPLVIGGWAKGSSVPAYIIEDSNNTYDPENMLRGIGIYVGLRETDGKIRWYLTKFNEDSSSWQYASNVVIPQKDYTEIFVYICYYHNVNSASFDGFQLYKEEFGQSYQYDSKGNITSTSDLANQNSTFNYNNNSDIVRYIDAKGSQFNYAYDSKRNLTQATSAQNVVYSFTYDTHGNTTSSKVGTSLFTETKFAYTSNGNYLRQVTDSRGNKTNFTWDETRGTITNVEDANKNRLEYQYDDFGRTTDVSKRKDSGTVKNSYTFINDKLSKINHNNFDYTFAYDGLGNATNIKVGTRNLITNTYQANTSYLNESTYGNGHKVSYGYDSLGRVTTVRHNSVDKFRYTYDGSGNLGFVDDLENNVKYRYVYDLADRLSKITDSKKNSYTYNYDLNNNVSKLTHFVNNKNYITNYTYDKDNRLTKLTLHNNRTFNYTYDAIGRINKVALLNGTTNFLTTDYTFVPGVDGSTTTLIKSVKNGSRMIDYTYDNLGNIETVTQEDKKIRYYYNELSELIREDNQVLNKTIVYSYDLAGNILSKVEYPYTTGAVDTASRTYNYSYNDTIWKDLLTSFDGKAITYDQIGNPLTYDGFTYTWEQGRQLKSLSKTGLNVSYKYNDSGIRTEKTVNGVKTTYTLEGSKVIMEQTGSDVIYYSYGPSGSPISMNLNGTEYYYAYNATNDIIAIYTGSGSLVVTYTYDSWGNTTIHGSLKDTVGIKNPYRYKGYRYDTETGLYYLQSRYYNPQWGRFINADIFISTGQGVLGTNMFAYCQNNPIKYLDIEGYFVGTALGYFIGGVGGAIGGGISAAIKGENILKGAGSGMVGGAIGGAITGAVVDFFVTGGTSIIAAMAIGALAGAAGGAASSMTSQLHSYSWNNDSMNGFQMDWSSVGYSALTGTVFSGLGTGFGQGVAQACHGSQVVGAFASSYFTVGNAGVDITIAAYSSNLSRRINKPVVRTSGGGGGGSFTQMAY